MGGEPILLLHGILYNEQHYIQYLSYCVAITK